MGINLVKPSQSEFMVTDAVISVALEWEQRVVAGVPLDCDLSIAMLGGAAGDRLLSERGLVFYNNQRSEDGALFHRGDAVEGGRMDEAEVIELQLDKVNPSIFHLYIFATVYESGPRQHSLGDLRNAMCRVRRGAGGATLARLPIPPMPLAGAADGCLIGRVSRSSAGWQFVQQWSHFEGGLETVIQRYYPT